MVRNDNLIHLERLALWRMGQIDPCDHEGIIRRRIALNRRQKAIRRVRIANPAIPLHVAAQMEDTGQLNQWTFGDVRRPDYGDMCTRLINYGARGYFAKLFYADSPAWYHGSMGITGKIAYARAWSCRRKFAAIARNKRDKRGRLIELQ